MSSHSWSEETHTYGRDRQTHMHVGLGGKPEAKPVEISLALPALELQELDGMHDHGPAFSYRAVAQ